MNAADKRATTGTRPARHLLSMEARFVAGALYLVGLLLLALWAHHGWPPGSSSGLWFYATSIAVLLAVFVSEPFYTSPKTALANSAALFLIVLTASRTNLEASKDVVHEGRIGLLALAALVFVLSGLAITTRDRLPRLNAVAYSLSVTLGAGYFLYGVAYVASVYAAFAKTPSKLAVLLVAPLLLSWNPLERAIRLIWSWRRPTLRGQYAVISRTEDPAIAIMESHSRRLAIGQRVKTSDATGVVVDVTETKQTQQARVVFPAGTLLEAGRTVEVLPPDTEPADPVVGYVAVGSALNSIRVAAPTAVSKTDIEEGRLLVAPIRDREVLFQVTGATVQEEALGTETHYRYRVDAQKLGSWNEASAAFDLVPWLPDPNTPVTMKTREQADFEPEGIGFVPGSRYAIRYAPVRAVTFNTAILGILGSGKTTLAKELVCRNIFDGMKVLVLDITGQYATFFDSLVPEVDSVDRLTDLNNNLAEWHARAAADQDRCWGSKGEFARRIGADIKAFLAGAEPIRIYNPAAFDVTTIDGFPRNGQAELHRELSMVEKTAVIANALLEATREQGETEQGRVCLVLEEAHSLTPEPNDGLNKDDHRAVITTARAVLQGRKFGYGCLLITQRTANVTKTILNQCHTVFALRSYDATGMAFLANYLGDEYAKLLSSMPPYHCVAFGEGISCTAPVLIRLNNPSTFRERCWDPRVSDFRPPPPVDEPAGHEEALDDLSHDDDIPF